MDSLLREEQVELAVTCAVFIVGLRKSLNPFQQSDFFTPWVKAPESEEEQFHQDLVWVYKVLPPNDKFNPDLAFKGVYKELRLKAVDDCWSNYDPEHKTEKRKHIPLTKYQSHSKGLRPSRPTRTKRSNHA